jgi:predicted permease
MGYAVRDLRYAVRQLKKTSGLTLICIVTLALGIGANTAVFSVMNAALLKLLPVEHPNQVVYLNTSGAPKRTGTIESRETFPYTVYDALRNQHGPLSQLMAYAPLSTGKVAVRYGSQPEEAEGDMVSGTFFTGLGVKLARGHGFSEQDEADHAPIAVVSFKYWNRRFGQNPDVLGKTLYVNSVPVTIVGVAAEGFEGLEAGRSTDFWIPLQSRPELNAWGNPPDQGRTYIANPTWWCLRLVGRLAPGVSKARAAEQLQPLFQTAAYIGLGSPLPGENRPTISLQEAKSFPGYDAQYGHPLRMMMTMVGFVLLIAVSNVAMLLMARNATRRREFSLRVALGSGRWELFGQLLIESVLLVSMGGIAAWMFANVATKALGQWAQIESTLAPDHQVLGFTLIILIVTTLLLGVAPLRVVLASGPSLVLKTSSLTSYTDRSISRTGRTIVTLQMALCVVLLLSGTLLVRTLQNLENIPLGMRADGLVVFGVKPQNMHSISENTAFYQELLRKLRVLPGVESATVLEERLGSGWSNNRLMMVDGKVDAGPNSTVRSNVVGADFFRTLGVPIVAGRDFKDSDTAKSPHVGIINELFARRFLPNQNPIGHTIGTEHGEFQMTIVGVVKNHKYRSIDEDPIPMAWYMYAQIPVAAKMNVELRVKGAPLAILASVRRTVQQIDPDLPLIQPTTQRAQFDTTISQQLLFARLAGFFAILAILLVATGLYGTLVYRVNNRTVEIGVRMAVGAQRAQVVWMVLRDSLVLTAIGAGIGVPFALLTGKALASVLYGLKPSDITSMTIALAGVALVGIGASVIPASRAAGIDPLTALREE